MKAILKNYRQSPRKVRLITSLIKGKTAERAIRELDLLIKKGSLPVKKVLQSALQNAVHNYGKTIENLFVKEAIVSEGTVLKRSMPRARGRAFPILKRSSHITITVAEKQN
jgi:large subunit ribosomal protein L22